MAEQSQHFDRVVAHLMNETPKINDAAKNLLSEEIAKSAISAEQRFESPELLQCIQKVLKGVRMVDLIDPVEWGKRNPQRENQSGLERVDEIIKYKAAYALLKRVKSSGESPSKFLGRTFLATVWTQVKAHVEGSESPRTEALALVMASFERSLQPPPAKEVDVIWTVNMAGAVQQRHKERQEQVAERAKEADRQREEFRKVVIEQLADSDDDDQQPHSSEN